MPIGKSRPAKQMSRAIGPVMTELLESRRLLSSTGFLVSDIDPGAGAGFSAGSDQIATVGNKIFFAGSDGTHGLQLWVSDGTAADTFVVKNIPSIQSTGPQNLTAGNGVVFFTGADANGVQQVWRSDGTSAGTFPVSEFTNSPSTQLPKNLFFDTEDNALFFGEATSVVDADDLWKTNANGAGSASLVKAGIDPQNFVDSSGATYFFGTDSLHGQELWTTDGSAKGTQLVGDSNPGPDPAEFTAIASIGNGEVAFATAVQPNGPQIWIAAPPGLPTPSRLFDLSTDGSDSAPILSSMSIISSLVFTKDRLDFVGDDGSGPQIWELSFQVGSNFMFHKATSLLGSGGGSGSFDNLTNVNGVLFFTFADSTGTHLYKLDLSDNTTKIADGGTSPNDLTNVNGTLYFAGQDSNGISRLFSTDGKTITQVGGNAGTDPNNITNVNGTAFYQSTDAAAGRELHDVVNFSIGSDVTVDQGNTLTFRPHLSGATIEKLQWDLDGDGTYEVTGTKPSRAYLKPTKPGHPITVTARLVTTDGKILHATLLLTVHAVPPTVIFDSPETIPYIPTPYTVTVTNFDGTPAKNAPVTIDFGDGTHASGLKTNSKGIVTGTHTFGALSFLSDTITVTALDADGITGTDHPENPVGILITDKAEVAALSPSYNGVLIGATDGDDKIAITPEAGKPVGGKYKYLTLHFDGIFIESFRTTGNVYIYTGPGNDAVSINSALNVNCFINGGVGDDTINSAAGNDTLIGGGGTDVFHGGSGMNTIEP